MQDDFKVASFVQPFTVSSMSAAWVRIKGLPCNLTALDPEADCLTAEIQGQPEHHSDPLNE